MGNKECYCYSQRDHVSHLIVFLSLALQVTLLSSTEYVFSAPKEDENWDEIDDFVNIKMLGREILNFKDHSIIYILL